MPDERFFIHLPARIKELESQAEISWWQTLLIPIGAAAAMAAAAFMGAYLVAGHVRFADKLNRAAAEWSAATASWESIDRVLAEAHEAGIYHLDRYFDSEPLETAVLAIEQIDSDEQTE